LLIRAFVKSRSERRDISKGQRAMGHAFLFPDPEKGGRGKTVPKRDSFSKQRLSDARTVLAYSRDLALAVRDGPETLKRGKLVDFTGYWQRHVSWIAGVTSKWLALGLDSMNTKTFWLLRTFWH
jgi:hypothetical protein